MKKDIEAVISYWRDPGDGTLPDPENDAEIFLGHHDEENHTMLIRDIRGEESSYSLDTHGFQVYTIPKNERDITNEDFVRTEYFEEISNLIKTATGAKEVVLFANMIRQLPRNALGPREFGGKKVQAPSPRPHVDMSPENAKTFAINRIPGNSWNSSGGAEGLEIAKLIDSATRWQLLGIWKPIKQVERDPLILTDSRSIPDSDYKDLPRDKTLPNGKWVLSVLRHGEDEHRWHYLSDMKPEEVFIFKHFDSKKDIPAWRCAHTSVEIPGTENLPPRESIEVRALVCY